MGEPAGGFSGGGVIGTEPEHTSRFVKLGKYYVNEALRPIDAWRLLWSQQLEFLGSEGKNVARLERVVERLPSNLVRCVRATRATARFLRARRRLEPDSVLELPFAGDIAIRRRSGAVKVLDLNHGRVITLMSGAQASGKLRTRLDRARRVEAYPFAPRVVAAGPDRGWFAEEFIPGVHPTGFKGCHEGFEDVYLPLLTALARAESPEWRTLGTYAEELTAQILSADGLLRQMPGPERDRVATFASRVRSSLVSSPHAQDGVPLVLSHGDLFSGNVVVPPDGGPRAIDWAHLGRRSALFDLYYVMMNHCVRVLPPHSVQRRIEEAVAALRSRLEEVDAAKSAELAPGLRACPELRRLFYLECVLVPLVNCDDPSDRYVRAMLQRIDWFEAHERAVADVGRLAGRDQASRRRT